MLRMVYVGVNLWIECSSVGISVGIEIVAVIGIGIGISIRTFGAVGMRMRCLNSAG